MSRAARTARRARMFKEQDECCHYCGGKMRLISGEAAKRATPDMATLEHLIQRADEGTYADDNTVVACASCNVSRPNGMETDKYLYLRRLLLEDWPACTAITPTARKMIQRAAPQSLYRIAHGVEPS